MVSRKKSAGKARRNKQKAWEEVKAKGEVQVGKNSNRAVTFVQQQVTSSARRYPRAALFLQPTSCRHGLELPSTYSYFMNKFSQIYYLGVGSGIYFEISLKKAQIATLGEFADVWKDSVKMEMAISYCLRHGTQHILEGNYDDARDFATFARYFEQNIAVKLDQKRALFNWQKIMETLYSDQHTLVKFFRRRIPCSCLDKKYEEVKHIIKLGICCSPQCKFGDKTSGERVERCKTMYCSRCRSVAYCSRECQRVDWLTHRPYCVTRTE